MKDLHSSICVGIQRIGSISKKIEEIRDRELQPQLEELIGGYASSNLTFLRPDLLISIHLISFLLCFLCNNMSVD